MAIAFGLRLHAQMGLQWSFFILVMNGLFFWGVEDGISILMRVTKL